MLLFSMLRHSSRLLLVPAASISSLLKPYPEEGHRLGIAKMEATFSRYGAETNFSQYGAEATFSRYGAEENSSYATEGGGYSARGRNSRMPKKSNHGKRPCSSLMRKLKKKMNYNKKGLGPDPTPDDPATSDEDKEQTAPEDVPELRDVDQAEGGEGKEEKGEEKKEEKKTEKAKDEDDDSGKKKKGKKGKGGDSD